MMRLFSLCLVVCACGSRPSPGYRDCPSAADAPCVLFAPSASGLSGEGSTVDHIAVRPASSPRGELLLFLNGSGSAPTDGRPVLRLARAQGLHAIALSYRSGQAVGSLCQGSDACFEPTRLALITGTSQSGAAASLANVKVDEGIEPRLLAALQLLVERDADGGWGTFLKNGEVDWSRVVTSGHSQGGGHAALLAKRHAVKRVLMLASPCDATSDGAPATWLSSASGWATDPSTAFFGVWSQGDMTCPAAPESWKRLGVKSQVADASRCGASPAHVAPLTCADNETHWLAALQP